MLSLKSTLTLVPAVSKFRITHQDGVYINGDWLTGSIP